MRHPDLTHLGRELRRRMDDTLAAEQHAARAAARRRRSLRDILLEAEDRARVVILATSDGGVHGGRIDAVGTDHVEITDGPTSRIVVLAHIVGVEVR